MKDLNRLKIIVESNGYQRLVVHAAQQLEGVPVEGHNTGREKHRVDTGIPGIPVTTLCFSLPVLCPSTGTPSNC